MINKAMSMVLGLVMLLVGVYVFFTVGPQILGMTLNAATSGYISNTTGCYVDMVGASDQPVNAIYCTGYTLFPILAAVGFFMAILALIFLWFKGVIKF